MEEGEFSEAREDLAALEQVLIPTFPNLVLNLVLIIILIIPNFLILLINIMHILSIILIFSQIQIITLLSPTK